MSVNGRIFGICVGLALMVGGCASVDLPKGKVGKYTSARFVKLDPNVKLAGGNRDGEIDGLIRQGITSRFEQEGLTVSDGDADLIIAFLLVTQNNVTTTTVGQYFGSGDDRAKILDVAHKKGVIKSNRIEAYEAGAVVIDVVDAQSSKLLYRNFAKRDIDRQRSKEEGKQVLEEAVNEALDAFFAK